MADKEQYLDEWKPDSLWDGVHHFVEDGNEAVKKLIGSLLPDSQGGRDIAETAVDATGAPAVGRVARSIAYGDPLTSGKNQTFRLNDDVVDAGMAVLPAVGPVLKGAKVAAKFVTPKALEVLENYADHPIYGVRSHVVAPENKQWSSKGITQLDEETSLLHGVMEDDKNPNRRAIADWVDGPLKKYMKTRMGTPSDEIRQLHEEGITHLPDSEFQSSIHFPEVDDWKPERPAGGFLNEQRREKAGRYGKRMGVSPHAKVWEDMADEYLNVKSPEQQIRDNETNVRNWGDRGGWYEKDNKWIHKLGPDDRVYSLDTGTGGQRAVGFDHLRDVLSAKLASGELRPEQLSKVSVADAVRMVHEDRVAALKKAENAATANMKDADIVASYPDRDLHWVRLSKPGQFAQESDAMGHSVRGYEPPKLVSSTHKQIMDEEFVIEHPEFEPNEADIKYFKNHLAYRASLRKTPEYQKWITEKYGHPDWVEASGDGGQSDYGYGGWDKIKSGDAKIFSLRDGKGKSHVTIEVGKGVVDNPYANFDRTNDFKSQLIEHIPEDKLKAFYEAEGYDNLHDFITDNVSRGKYMDQEESANLGEWIHSEADPEGWAKMQKKMADDGHTWEINQVKGKGNDTKFPEKYHEPIRDFIRRGGKWSKVNDLPEEIFNDAMQIDHLYDGTEDFPKDHWMNKLGSSKHVTAGLGAVGALGAAGAAEAKTQDKDLEASPVAEHLVKAIIHHESGGNPYAYSDAGAKGMMQLMPKTAKSLGVTNIYDKGQNIKAGTKYIGQLITKYDGDIRKALIAYNWGPGNVAKYGIDKAPSVSKQYADNIMRMTKDLEGKAKSDIQHLTPKAQEFLRNYIKNRGQ
jgi:hypothetical protein